jgi:hypothetical protein
LAPQLLPQQHKHLLQQTAQQEVKPQPQQQLWTEQWMMTRLKQQQLCKQQRTFWQLQQQMRPQQLMHWAQQTL